MAKKITNLLAKITSGLSHAFLSSQLEFSASQHMYGILIWSTKTMIPLEMHICQVPKISFLAYLEWSTNKIMAGKAFWGCSVQIREGVEFLQVQLNSYGAGSYEDFVWKDSRLSYQVSLASISCWWMSFKENEGEEGKKRGEKIAGITAPICSLQRDWSIVFTLLTEQWHNGQSLAYKKTL